jgi:hypothetical protein
MGRGKKWAGALGTVEFKDEETMEKFKALVESMKDSVSIADIASLRMVSLSSKVPANNLRASSMTTDDLNIPKGMLLESFSTEYKDAGEACMNVTVHVNPGAMSTAFRVIEQLPKGTFWSLNSMPSGGSGRGAELQLTRLPIGWHFEKLEEGDPLKEWLRLGAELKEAKEQIKRNGGYWIPARLTGGDKIFVPFIYDENSD